MIRSTLPLLLSIAAMAADLPPDAVYTVPTPEGHLSQGGQRVRHWGFIGWVVPEGQKRAPVDAPRLEHDRKTIDLMVQRIVDLGFTSIRLWEHPDGDDYQQGDGSRSDLLAYYLWKLDLKGVKVWCSLPTDPGSFSADDVGIIDDPATAEAWKAAVVQAAAGNGGKAPELRNYQARIWDPRIEALGLRGMRRLADFPNRYKDGLRLGDDPQMIVWELSNEEIWFWGAFGGRWQGLPAHFRNELATAWNAFLVRKYGDEAKLKAAWHSLLPGESLASGTVLLAPLASPVAATTAINDTNPAARESLKVLPQSITRDDVVRQRGSDVVEFLTDLLIQHKKRETAALKSWGKSCRLATTIWDCGNCYQIQSQYMFSQPESGAVSACAYVSGMGYDPTDKRFPFWSGLESSPRMCWDVPWMEQSRVPGKPTFIYETQIGNKTKYRAEFPLRLAAIGAINDWDIVNWHIYGHAADIAAEKPFDTPLAVWHDYFGYGADEVQCSAMKAAAQTFTRSLLLPAPKPTTFVFGKRSLYAPESMDYGRSYGDAGKRFIPTAYRYGAQVRIDPTRDDDALEGPSIPQGVFEPCPLSPTKQIAYDWNKGFLTFDAPGVISYTGFFGQYGKPAVAFGDGASFSAISVANPAGMPYPVTPEEGYVALTLTSADGQPLAACKKAYLSAVSTSFNTKFTVDITKGSRGMSQQGPDPAGPKEFSGAWVEAGTTPVLVARVGVTVTHPGIAGMRFAAKDWHQETIAEGVVGADGKYTLPSTLPAFLVEFSR